MFRFLLKGVLRDRSRSLFPVLVIVAGVMLTVFMYSWLNGVLNDMFDSNASLQTGHVKITTRAYAAQSSQRPNDLAIIGVDSLIAECEAKFPDMVWLPRIEFGGLIDIPDENMETRAQGPTFGIAAKILSKNSIEKDLLNLEQAIVSGRMVQQSGEILIADEFAKKLKVNLNETATLISSTMHGSTSLYNFTVVGTVHFGINAMDRGAIIADLADIQTALDMEDAASEVLGFFDDFHYKIKKSGLVSEQFNKLYSDPQEEFSPVMVALANQNGLADMLHMATAGISIIVGIFLFVMFVVLWNAGLMGSIRRYGEIGVRLAIGEDKGHLYRAMLMESLIIGVIGSLIGTAIGLTFSYIMQYKGIDMGSTMKNSTILMSNIYRARVTTTSYVIGFIPGILATFLGTAVSGIGIYKRQTSQLFKELEV